MTFRMFRASSEVINCSILSSRKEGKFTCNNLRKQKQTVIKVKLTLFLKNVTT